MSVVKINVLTVPAERREVLEERFASRTGEVDTTPGFESFQLLRPTDDSDRYFVMTHWETEEAFNAWMESRAFQRGHARAGGDSSGDGEQAPAASGSELLSFEVIQESHATA